MKTRLLFVCIVCSLVFASVLYYLQSTQNAAHTIKFFPLDERMSFVEASTTIRMNEDDTISWEVASDAEEAMYLRQDVSLLYENGMFKGVQSKWQQNQKEMALTQIVPLTKTGLLEAISFHQGEIHQSPQEITTIQKMTADKLFVSKQNQVIKPLENDSPIASKINKDKKAALAQTWREWMHHYEINESAYHAIPLAGLVEYENKALPGLTQKQSKETIGKLWEGLYKNYILRLKEIQNQQETHPMPLILISNDADHLYVLFELNGHKEMLLQKIAVN